MKHFLLFLSLALCVKDVQARNDQARQETAQEVMWVDRITMYDDPYKYTTASSFSLVNPKALKGGALKLSVVGPSFTTVNPFYPQQESAPWVAQLTFDSLMIRSPDEPFVLYSMLAKSIQVPPHRGWLIIRLHPKARFSNGQPVTAEDVLFTYHTLAKYGAPGRRALAAKVKQVTAVAPDTVRFDFYPDEKGVYDRELPMLILLMNVFSKDSLGEKSFPQMGLTPLIGSGPYVIGRIEPGKKITYVRNPHYWAKDLPLNQGRFNVDEITFELFSGEVPAFESFKLNLVDLWEERDPQRWKKGYTFAAVRQGKIRRQEIVHGCPVGMYGFALNQNHPALQDWRVRKALMVAFDYGLIRPQMDQDCRYTESFFQNVFQASPMPDREESVILARLPQPLSDTALPASTKNLSDAERRKLALDLLAQAGWHPQGTQILKGGKPLKLTILVKDYEQKKLAEILAQCLKRINIGVIIEQADETQYAKRVNDRAFDLMIYRWIHSMSPGSEQTLYWHSKSANQVRSRNYGNIRNPNVDFLCENLTKTTSWNQLKAGLRALDRVLLQGYYVIPLFYRAKDYRAFWQHVKTPPFQPHSPYFPGLESYWIEPTCIESSPQ